MPLVGLLELPYPLLTVTTSQGLLFPTVLRSLPKVHVFTLNLSFQTRKCVERPIRTEPKKVHKRTFVSTGGLLEALHYTQGRSSGHACNIQNFTCNEINVN